MSTATSTQPVWKREWPLALALVALGLSLATKSAMPELLNHPVALIAKLALMCGVILVAAVAIVRHADVLAHRLGEPAGTLLLTLAVTGLEVAMVGFVMSTGSEKPTLARDTMFAVTMLVINGFMGLALVLGGLRYSEQGYNLKSANAFLIMILPLTVLGLILPNYTTSSAGPTLSTFQMIFLSVLSVGIYAIFLYVQNGRHRGFFIDPEEAQQLTAAHHVAEAGQAAHHHSPHSTLFHAVMLGAYGLPLVMLAKQMSYPLDAMVLKLGAPIALGGFILALLVLAPESIAAIKAARQNRLQRSVNVLLGSVLASIGLTIPLVITVSLFTGRDLYLGLQPAESVMLILTLLTAMLAFSQSRTHVLLGCVHLLLFGAYFMLLFD